MEKESVIFIKRVVSHSEMMLSPIFTVVTTQRGVQCRFPSCDVRQLLSVVVSVTFCQKWCLLHFVMSGIIFYLTSYLPKDYWQIADG